MTAADVDGDGDMDVLSKFYDQIDNTFKIAWYPNIDGKGRFGRQRFITLETPSNVRVLITADIDGDIDVLSASNRKLFWDENTNGRGAFGSQHVIDEVDSFVNVAYAADVDGDGDLDVLAKGFSQNIIAWYENTDGKGSFGDLKVITTKAVAVVSVTVADLDGDGDADVVSALYGDHKIAWYENTDGKGSFGPQRVITTEANHARSVTVADVDGDGDLDVLSASSQDDKIAWYENTDGKGNFGPQRVISIEADFAVSVFVADVDGDGDVDVLSASGNRIAWYENLSAEAAAGDANRDGQFDQLDIVQVLQVANFLTGESATFEEGDWNGDGMFDQADIVAALQTGNYLQGPHAVRHVGSTLNGDNTIKDTKFEAVDMLMAEFR